MSLYYIYDRLTYLICVVGMIVFVMTRIIEIAPIETDSEADMYCAYINDTSDEGKELAKQYVQILEDLFDNEEDIYDFLKHNADDIEWD